MLQLLAFTLLSAGPGCRALAAPLAVPEADPVLITRYSDGTWPGIFSPTSSNETVIIDVNDPVNGPLEATAWSIIYTSPFASYAGVMSSLLQATPANQLFHQETFPEPGPSRIVSPNLDVLYSFAPLDLSHNDVVLKVPKISGDRFWSYQVNDMFGNAIGEITNVNNNQAGSYRIRRNITATPGYSSSGDPRFEGLVDLSTAYGTLAVRIGINANTAEDQSIINGIQNASSLELTDLSARGTVPALADLNLTAVSSIEAQLRFAAQLIPYNLPQVVSDRDRVNSVLAQAGISRGTYTPRRNVNITLAAMIANNSITADVENPAHWQMFNDNWSVGIDSYQGNYGTNYAALAMYSLYGMQTRKVALYAKHPVVGFGTPISATNTSILYTFTSKPPVVSPGFWSLTAYTPDMELIANPLNRYVMGSRSTEIQYTAGGKVYGDDANTSEDGEFQILVQNRDVPPPANWTGNWLPVSDTFLLAHRFYWPTEELNNGSWTWPTIKQIPIITE